MSGTTRIQLCGRLVVEIDGRRVERQLPGRQGRLLLAYLAASRSGPCTRSELIDVLWADSAPPSADGVLRSLLSKLRGVLGEGRIDGRSTVRLTLPPAARVDCELAAERLHDAESALAQGRWTAAWLPARIAHSVSGRTFLAGHEGPWVDERRRELAQLHERALECVARVGLGLGGPELVAAERAARALVERNPYLESAQLLLIESLAARANVAEALRVYDGVRSLLRRELGLPPGAELQAAHERLLGRA